MSSWEIIADCGDRCGEAPLWDASRQRLLWTDITGQCVHEWRAGATRTLWRGRTVAGLALNRDGRLVLAGAEGVWLEGSDLLPALAGWNFNDILAEPGGGLYGGTYHWNESGMTRHGALYRLAPDGAPRLVDDGIELANGLGLSPDARTLYFTDTTARVIYAYDVAGVDLRNKRVFARVPATEGLPDGLTVDAAGFVWSAQWYGGQVVRYDPAGAVERRIALPVSQVSSVAFGGPDLTDLFVTTAGELWRSTFMPPGFDRHGALGGALYRVQGDVPGKPDYQCAFL